jgi:phosphonate transport system substrate-binding protein
MAPNAEEACREITRLLEQRLNMRTQFVDNISWQEREQLLDRGEVHLCWLCGLPYVWKADQSAPSIELVAAPIMASPRYGNQAVYFSDIVVHKKSRFATFEDLRGSSWTYNEPRSHSGYYVVLDHLRRLDETDGYFGEAIESGAHQQSLRMIIDGKVDASAIDSTVLDAELTRYPELRNEIRVIHTLGPSPMPPWVMLRSLPSPVKQSIRNVFLSMADDDEGCAVLKLWGVARFAPVNDTYYTPIRAMARNAQGVRLSTLD